MVMLMGRMHDLAVYRNTPSTTPPPLISPSLAVALYVPLPFPLSFLRLTQSIFHERRGLTRMRCFLHMEVEHRRKLEGGGDGSMTTVYPSS